MNVVGSPGPLEFIAMTVILYGIKPPTEKKIDLTETVK